MIYIIFAITVIINIFNILLISNNNVIQNKKEKILLLTYSIAELVYISFTISLIQYTAANTVIVLSFIIIWLLSKSYILVINMNFEDNEKEVITMESEIKNNKEPEGREEKVQGETSNIQEEDVKAEKIKLSDLVENAQEKILTPTSLHKLSDIVESAKINKEEEIRMRRRSLALRTGKSTNSAQ